MIGYTDRFCAWGSVYWRKLKKLFLENLKKRQKVLCFWGRGYLLLCDTECTYNNYIPTYISKYVNVWAQILCENRFFSLMRIYVKSLGEFCLKMEKL